jgi:hypothetical protein
MLKSRYTKTNVFNRWVKSSTPYHISLFGVKMGMSYLFIYEGKSPHFGILKKKSKLKYNVHMQLKSKCLIHPWLGYLHAYEWTLNVSKDNNVMVNIRLVMESKGDL